MCSCIVAAVWNAQLCVILWDWRGAVWNAQLCVILLDWRGDLERAALCDSLGLARRGLEP